VKTERHLRGVSTHTWQKKYIYYTSSATSFDPHVTEKKFRLTRGRKNILLCQLRMQYKKEHLFLVVSIGGDKAPSNFSKQALDALDTLNTAVSAKNAISEYF